MHELVMSLGIKERGLGPKNKEYVKQILPNLQRLLVWRSGYDGGILIQRLWVQIPVITIVKKKFRVVNVDGEVVWILGVGGEVV